MSLEIEQYVEFCNLLLSPGVHAIFVCGLRGRSQIVGHDLGALRPQSQWMMIHLMTSPVEHQTMSDVSQTLAIVQLACVLPLGESRAEFGKLALQLK